MLQDPHDSSDEASGADDEDAEDADDIDPYKMGVAELREELKRCMYSRPRSSMLLAIR